MMIGLSRASTMEMDSPVQFKAMESYKTFFDNFDDMHKRMVREWDFLESVDKRVIQNMVHQGSYKIELDSDLPSKQEPWPVPRPSEVKCEALGARFSLLDGDQHISAAECNALLIHPKNFENGFYAEMADISREPSAMAKALCDNNGTLRKELRSMQNKSVEPDLTNFRDKDIMLLEFLHVAPVCRGIGIGKKVVEAMFQHVVERGDQFVCVCTPVVYEAYTESHAAEFMRSMGFRRIGSTNYFFLVCSSKSLQ